MKAKTAHEDRAAITIEGCVPSPLQIAGDGQAAVDAHGRVGLGDVFARP
jgi:hypothetical protein